MNNVQKISSAVILFAVGLGFTTLEEYVPIKGNCIAIIPEYEAECGSEAQKKDKRYCIGGKDFICTKPISSGHNRVPTKPSPAKSSPVEAPFTPAPIPTPAVPTKPTVSEVPAWTFPVPVDTIPMPVETIPAPAPIDGTPVPVETEPATGAPYTVEIPPTSR